MIRVFGIVVTLVAAAAALFWLSRDLAPPKTLVFAAGGEGGGYWTLAQRYKQILARDGIAVEVLATKGSVENAQLLAEGRAQVAILQGGIVTEEGLETLGALFLEPVFLFTRADAGVPENPGQWQGLRAAVGGEGSGTRAAVLTLMRAARLDFSAVDLDTRGGEAAVAALLAGEVDMAVFVAPLSAPYLQPLFQDEGARLVRLEHVEALSRRLPQSEVTELPSGALSLDPALPEVPLPLLTMVASLVAQPDLHPSLVDRLVEAARIIHGRRDALAEDGQFPNMEGAALPPDPYARDLIASGTSPLQQVLPYWVVAQINRFVILLVPALLLLLPILRMLPGIYAWRMRARVFRHYATIREIELEAQEAPIEALDEMEARLAALDAELAELRLPLPYREYAYTARLHIDLLLSKLAERRNAA